MKRSVALTFALFMLIVPALLLAKDVGNRDLFRIGKAEFTSSTEFTVPIQVVHDEDLAAMDIPLNYSKGVTLNNVTFEGTRVADFDVKIFSIDAENNRVVIGLIPMVYALKENASLKPAPNADNTVGKLHFTLNDQTLKSIEIGHFVTDAPAHDLLYVYNEWIDGVPHVRELVPEFEGGTVALDSRAPSVALPTEFGLSQNIPNPFNPSTRVTYALPTDSKVNLAVYNVLGQHVKTLVDGFVPAGINSSEWDGTDQGGQTVASGVYFYKISAGSFTDTKKMLMLK